MVEKEVKAVVIDCSGFWQIAIDSEEGDSNESQEEKDNLN